MAISTEMERLMQEVRKDSAALQRLKDKAAWEHMSRYAILREWGDPRTWTYATHETAKTGR